MKSDHGQTNLTHLGALVLCVFLRNPNSLVALRGFLAIFLPLGAPKISSNNVVDKGQ